MHERERDLLNELQEWYGQQCDGDWEHEFAISIENIDNPGWSIAVPLTETSLQDREFAPVRRGTQESGDWILCRVEDGRFLGDGGKLNLSAILTVFLDWASESGM